MCEIRLTKVKHFLYNYKGLPAMECPLGELSERSKVQHSKCCVGKTTWGSNP